MRRGLLSLCSCQNHCPPDDGVVVADKNADGKDLRDQSRQKPIAQQLIVYILNGAGRSDPLTCATTENSRAELNIHVPPCHWQRYECVMRNGRTKAQCRHQSEINNHYQRSTYNLGGRKSAFFGVADAVIFDRTSLGWARFRMATPGRSPNLILGVGEDSPLYGTFAKQESLVISLTNCRQSNSLLIRGRYGLARGRSLAGRLGSGGGVRGRSV